MLDRQNEPFGPDTEDDVTPLACKVDYLSRPDTYIPASKTVITRETHMSWVFMAGDRVYKLKKPVQFPILIFPRLSAAPQPAGQRCPSTEDWRQTSILARSL